MLATVASSARWAAAFEMSADLAMWSIISFLFTGDPLFGGIRSRTTGRVAELAYGGRAESKLIATRLSQCQGRNPSAAPDPHRLAAVSKRQWVTTPVTDASSGTGCTGACGWPSASG